MSGQRVHERHDHELPVTIIHDGKELTGATQNVSLGGMLVNQVSGEVPFGAAVQVRMHLPAMKQEMTVDATVRWSAPDGVGLQFGSLRAMEVWALNQLFSAG